jgi:hypothetical protein
MDRQLRDTRGMRLPRHIGGSRYRYGNHGISPGALVWPHNNRDLAGYALGQVHRVSQGSQMIPEAQPRAARPDSSRTSLIPPFIYCMTFRARKGNEIASFMSGYIIEVVSYISHPPCRRKLRIYMAVQPERRDLNAQTLQVDAIFYAADRYFTSRRACC